MDRETRRLHQNKADKPQILKTFPPNTSGNNGDIVFIKNGPAMSQAIKSSGRWIMIGEGTPTATSSKTAGSMTTRVVYSGSGGPGTSGAVLQNGSTPFTATQVGITPTIDTHLATKAYVDASSSSSGWTMAGDSGSNQSILAGNTATLSGGTGISTTASATDTLTIANTGVTSITGGTSITASAGTGSVTMSVTGDSITDTQLAYNTGQHLTTSSAVTFGTVNTGQGATEVHLMNQNIRTSDDVQFGDIIVDGDDITSNPFTSGFVGSGWKIDNTAHAEFSSASIRGTLSVYELLLQQLRATNGSVLITAVAKIESIDGSDITFEDPSDNGICPFHTNDIVMVQRAALTGSSSGDSGGGTLNVIRRLVRRVTGVSGRTITVTRDGDLPADTGSFGVGDDVVRIGNTTNTSRDALLYLSADDSKAPYLVIKDGVNSWANFGSATTEKARLGRLDGITDTDAGLSGSQSNLYGLYSDSVYLKGHVFATSGEIGGIKMASNKLYVGTGTHNNANTGFYLDDGGDFSLEDKLVWDASANSLTVTGTINIGNPGDIDAADINDDGTYTDDTAADAAQGTANTGVTNAATAQGTANTAETNAQTGITNAATAQTTANTGVTNAATAQTAANAAQSTANGRNTSFYQDGIPTSLAAGDIWFDTNDGLKMYRARGAGDNEISGSEWVAVAGEGVGIGTLITGSGVYTGTLTAGQVNAVAIDAGSITAGTLTGRTVQTASGTGQRVVIDGSNNKLNFYNSSNVSMIQMDGGGTGYSTGLHLLSGSHINLSNGVGAYPNNTSDSTMTITPQQIAITTRTDYPAASGIFSQHIANSSSAYIRAGYFACTNSDGSGDAIALECGSGAFVATTKSWFGGSHSKTYRDAVVNIKSTTTNDSGDGQALRFYEYGGWDYWNINIDAQGDLSFRHNSGTDGGYLSDSSNVNQINFTGQHRAIGNSGMTAAEYGAMIGYIVRADGNYNNIEDGGSTPTIDDSMPVIELSDSNEDKKVFGVISSHEEGSERQFSVGAWVTCTGLTEGEERVIVNSLGEGAIWVTNLNGNLENGDYVTSSTAAGLGQKQDDDLLHNYTVAKITQDCDFSSGTEFEHGGQTYKKEFVGCTYHCG